MKKLFLIVLSLVMSTIGFAQAKIQLRSADKAECVQSDYTSLKANFSFSSLDAERIETTRGSFSELHIDGAYPNGNVGEPQLPMFTRLIAIPTGATPIVTVGAHSETQYTLKDYGIGKVSAMQAPIRKSVDPSTVDYAYNEAAYTRNSFNEDPIAMVEVLGTMRGITMGRLIVQPVRYNPVAGTIKVFNDIEVSVDFENGDAESTEKMFKSTCSPAFQSVYDQIFNIEMLMGDRDAYTDHPDMYNTPVKMLVICYSGFKNNSALNSWLQWKLQKGYYVDIHYTDETGTTAANIKDFIKTKYNASVSAGNAYTYLIVIGDTGQVPQYMTKTVDEQCASDLGYSSVNFSTSSTTNYFPDMYYSRMSVENTTHLTNYINKVLTYEKYEFDDGGDYLNNVILVGGWDSSWTSRVAKPTINYATNYYFKSSNTTYGGFGSGTISATVSTSSSGGYSSTNNGVYNGINNGVCFLNYTAHGDKQEWYQPNMTAAHVATLTNTGKYFFGVGNCCLTGNFNNTSTSYSPGSAIGTNACFAETMIRVPNAGAIAYIGSSPYSYWYEDFYWAVGAHSYSAGNYPTTSASSKGVYDIMFTDEYWNSASSLMYLGNLAVQQAVTSNYTTSSITDGDCNNSAHYYFQFYHTFGDGSVMPYITKPETNTVTIPSTVTPGTTSITVNAVAGSYVAVTDNSSVIYGVAEANSSGKATVTFTESIPTNGTLYVVVTRQQYQPYFGTISVVGGTKYDITASANPTAGGTVAGAGEYYETTQCTLTATANAPQYEFTNWEKGNSVVSTNPTYTFTVSSSTAGAYVANFTALTSHSITLNSVTNGYIYSNKTSAYKGEVVTLSATPVEGYVLTAWTVKDASNNTITVTDNQFTMPDSNVTVSATFVKGNAVTLASVMNGTISADAEYALQGTTINLTATPASGYNMDGWVVYKTGDVNTTITVSGNSFTMPNYDVTVSAIFSAPQGGEVTIGSGTSTSNGQYVPTSVYYNYSLTQQIYTAEELGDAGTITDISFYYGSTTNSGSRTLNIYMSHTTSSTITAWSTVSSSQLVYSGSINFTQGWNTLTLTTPFAYNGTSNILITVDDNTGSYNGNYSFYTYSTSANRAIYYRSDTSNPTPTGTVSVTAYSIQNNAQMKVTKVVPDSDGYLSVSPTTLSGFTAVGGSTASDAQSVAIVGSNLSSNVTVTMPAGYEAATTATGAYSTSLSLTPSNGSLRQMVYVRLQAGLSENNYNGTMTIASGNSTTTVTLSGTVTPGSGTQYVITVNANPANGGTMSGAGTYYENGTCSLVATANQGFAFEGWQYNSSVVSTNATYSFTVTEQTAGTYTALFTELPTYTVTVSEVPNGTISADKTTAYPGENVNLTVNANQGFELNRWLVYKTGDIESLIEVNNNSFVMPEYDVTVFAVIKDNFEEVTVGSGTDISYGYVLPTHVYYNYSLSQQIYTAAEVGEAGTITAFQLYFAGTSSGAASTTGPRTFKIYMTHTNNSTVSSWTTVSSNDLVYQGTMTFEQLGWYTFTLNTPFEYNGTSNLMLTVDDCTGNYVVSERHYFYDYNTGSTRAIYDVTDDGEYDPTTSHSASARTCQYNNQIIFTKGTEAGATLSALPNPLEGFAYKEGEGPSGVFEFAVIGVDLTANVTVTAPDHFEICATENGNFGSTLTLTKNDLLTANIYVRMKAGLAQGNYSEVLSLTSGDVNTEVTLAGQVTQGDVVYYTITATASPAEGGTVSGAGQYPDQATPHLIATANDGYLFVNWTENGEVVSTNPTFIFTADSNRDLVANFIAAATQTQTMNAGWNWFSTYIDMQNGGLAIVENALGDNGIQIKSQNIGFTSYAEGEWFGTLNTMSNDEMYQIKVTNTEEISITGPVADPNDYPINLVNGWNWIGYPMDETLDIATALGNFQPTSNDMIKGRNGYCTYVEGYGWWGSLNALTPGIGYMYRSYNSAANFTFHRGNKVNDVVLNNVETYWTPAAEDFAFNGNVMATVNAEGLTLSEEMEIGAFVNGECRGAAKLMYVEPLDQYVAFLTVFGDNDEEVSFKIYNEGETFTADEQVVYTNNMVIGTVAEPFVLHISQANAITFFPNPVTCGQEVRLDLPTSVRGNVHVQVFNALGVEVRNEMVSNTISGIMASGMYTLRVTDEQGAVYYGKLIVR